MNGMHGIIFSYEKRNDLRELGEIRSASSIPFGGRYRAVDFALSNLVNAGVTDVVCWTTWAPARTGTCPASGAA
ncbi:glucose-1-phosphate adenylyltransferase [uncultured Blautia sp.]|nr:glucose-1-phosphate adenylyltransferase [uncultured Blautia sp.]